MAHSSRYSRHVPLLVAGIAVSFFLLFLTFYSDLASRAWRMPTAPSPDHDVDIPATTPVPPEDAYKDRDLYLNASDPPAPNHLDWKHLRYAVFLPTFVDHFSLAADFFRSLRCLCIDHAEIDFYAIVSDSAEADGFRKLLDSMEACGPKFGRWQVPDKNKDGPMPDVNIVNMYDILPDGLRGEGMSRQDTSKLLQDRGKLVYQSIKKLAAAMHYDYDYALWLDSESIAVRPMRFRETFEAYLKAPNIWRSRMTSTDLMRDVMANSGKVLGRTMDSFAPALWTLESTQWFIEKAVVSDLVRYVEGAHGRDFWSVYCDNGGPFEANLYNLHIMTRKLETTASIFSKYAVLETEREVRRFGLAPVLPEIESKLGTGLLERIFHVLQSPRIGEVRPNLSAFLRRYGQRLIRLETLDTATPQILDQLLLETPLDLLVSGAPPLHAWWSEMVEKGVLGDGIANVTVP